MSRQSDVTIKQGRQFGAGTRNGPGGKGERADNESLLGFVSRDHDDDDDDGQRKMFRPGLRKIPPSRITPKEE